MTAVAVWPMHPSHRAMLDARLARGWRPTPSGLKAGPAVLGYAACVFHAHDPATGPAPEEP